MKLKMSKSFGIATQANVIDKCTRTLLTCLVFEVLLCNLLPSRCDFITCGQIVQRSYCHSAEIREAKYASYPDLWELRSHL